MEGGGIVLVGVLQLIALVRYTETVEWGRPGSWLYVLFMVGFVFGGIYTAINAWGLLAQPAEVAMQ